MNIFNSTLVSTCRKPIGFFGIIPCASFALFLAFLAIAYIRAGSLDQEASQRLVHQASQQQIRAMQLNIDTLSLDRAVRTQSWDRVEPTLNDLITTHNAWLNSFESLRSEHANAFRAPGDEDSITDYYTRLTYIYNDVSQAIDELRIVGQSVVRRAPFIDPSSEARLAAAVESYQTHQPQFDQISSEILALYQLQADQAVVSNSATIRRALGIMLASMVIALGLGITPRLHQLRSRVSMLESNDSPQPNLQMPAEPTAQHETHKAA